MRTTFLRNIDSVVYSDRADNRIAQSDSAIIADDDISYGIVQAGVIFNDRNIYLTGIGGRGEGLFWTTAIDLPPLFPFFNIDRLQYPYPPIGARFHRMHDESMNPFL